VDGSWRWSLALWGAPLVVFAVLVLAFAPRAGGVVRSASRWWPEWNSALLWRLGFVFASITSSYISTNAFLPAHLAAQDRADLVAPALSALNGGQIPASFILLAISSRLAGRPGPLVALGVVALVCIVGVMTTASGWTIVFSAALGFVLAAALTLGLTLPVLLSAPDDMARVTAGMFTISYLVAVAVSVVAGAAWDVSGLVAAAFVVIALGALPLVIVTPTIDFKRARSSGG
jgi:CP family cyanate transporter-like MFS transporter